MSTVRPLEEDPATNSVSTSIDRSEQSLTTVRLSSRLIMLDQKNGSRISGITTSSQSLVSLALESLDRPPTLQLTRCPFICRQTAHLSPSLPRTFFPRSSIRLLSQISHRSSSECHSRDRSRRSPTLPATLDSPLSHDRCLDHYHSRHLPIFFR